MGEVVLAQAHQLPLQVGDDFCHLGREAGPATTTDYYTNLASDPLPVRPPCWDAELPSIHS